ncbi:hypothetical protein N431DRAFT_497148 [Stipitochalara longipes BDJ]|nr:hypothetical protein N431DRAFT_497148 [Stipitochalara longipes BDJ]
MSSLLPRPLTAMQTLSPTNQYSLRTGSCSRPPVNPSFNPFRTNVLSMIDVSHTSDSQIGSERLDLGILPMMAGLEEFSEVPVITYSTASFLACDTVRMEDIQPVSATISPDTRALQVLDENPPHLRPCSETFICQWRGCQASFKKMTEFRLHVRSHTTEAPRCLWDACSRPPESRSSLNKHLDSHTKPHLCPQNGCGHRAAKLRDMGRHLLSHGTPNGAKVYYCPARDCQYSEGRTSFSRADNAKRHIRQMHSNTTGEIITRTHDS